MSTIFLDRDGVINRFPGLGHYVTRWEDFEFLPRVPEAIALLSRAGHEVIVISNQGCVGHGLLTSRELGELTDRMRSEIARAGGKIDGVYYCEHRTIDACGCKKPKIGLFDAALAGRNIDLRSTWFIGDSEIDIEAGRNLGCHTLLVLSGRLTEAEVKDLRFKPHAVKKDLWEAVNWILEKES